MGKQITNMKRGPRSDATEDVVVVSKWQYAVTAFCIGFVMMAYELLGSRLLAPTVGSSIYIWTSVIGVIVAALSLGYAAGGLIADKRTDRRDIVWLLVAAAYGITMTMLLSGSVLDLISRHVHDLRLRGLFAALALFAPTSFILGSLSPYLARLNNLSLETTGRAVASLSSMNAIGGILGTFSTGYILFAVMGVREIMLALAGLLILNSWLLIPKTFLAIRAALTVGVVMLMLLTVSTTTQARGVVDDVDTPTAHYQIRDIYYKGQYARIVQSGPLAAQSGIRLNNPDELLFPYTKAIARIVTATGHKEKVLFLGGGTFTLPQYIAQKSPRTQIDVVEIDPGLTDIARKYFNLRDYPNFRIISDDARAFLNNNTALYDVVIVDVYNDISVPFSLTTREYVERVRASLRADGIVVVNAIGGTNNRCMPYLSSLHAAYLSGFSRSWVYPTIDSSMRQTQNIELVYSNKDQAMLPGDGQTQLAPKGQVDLTDNFAPVEALWQRCRA